MNHFKHILKALVIIITTAFIMSGITLAGDLEPSAPPASTMHTLEEVYNKLDGMAVLDKALVEKSGQTTSYSTGDDGEYEAGLAFPSPRFTDNGDGTVTDNLTGLVWLKNADCFGTRNWATALTDCNSLADGSCGLTDGSSAGDWRLPHMKEVLSLIHLGSFIPPLPPGHPFTNVAIFTYWTGSTRASDITRARSASMSSGNVGWDVKTDSRNVWPVRNGN